MKKEQAEKVYIASYCKNLKENIVRSANGIIDSIVSYSVTQATYWRQLPYLALQADGRTGFNDNYARAYTYGYWPVKASYDFGKYHVFVDLETGLLVHAYDDIPMPADKNEVLKLAFSLDQLDAAALVKELRQAGQAPHSAGHNPVKMKKWRESIRKDLNLKPIYKRT